MAALRRLCVLGTACLPVTYSFPRSKLIPCCNRLVWEQSSSNDRNDWQGTFLAVLMMKSNGYLKWVKMIFWPLGFMSLCNSGPLEQLAAQLFSLTQNFIRRPETQGCLSFVPFFWWHWTEEMSSWSKMALEIPYVVGMLPPNSPVFSSLSGAYFFSPEQNSECRWDGNCANFSWDVYRNDRHR